MAAYFYTTGYTNHPLYISFIVYCFSFFIISHSAKRFSLFRTFFCLFLDNYFTIAGLYVTGEKGTFLFILLTQISIGYGLRFGRVYHWTSVLVACVGVIILYLYSPSWKGNLHLALAYVIGTPFIAFYIDFLVKNLKRSKLESDERANDIADLLAFVPHDIRTPHHSLLTTAAAAKSNADDEQMRARITRIEDGIRSLARLATDVLSATSGDVRKPRDLRTTISVCQWVIEVSRRFRDELESKNIRLIYSFNMDVWAAISLDLLPAERLLLNTLSNAVRHAGNGEIEIKLTLTCHNESKGDLVFTITNRLGKPTGIADSLSVSEPAASSKEYYGAGLGLLVANELASSLNGDFSFHQNDLNEYITRIRIPCYHASNDEISGVLLPLVLVTQSIDLVSRFRSVLRDETNVIIFRRIQDLSSFVRDIDKNVAAIIIDEALVGDTLATSSAASTLTLPKYYSLIQSTADVRPSALPHSALNSIGSDPSDREILNTVRSQSAIRENETLGDLNLENINSGTLKGKHVLILDDNRVNRALLQEGIRNAEGEITIAANIVDGVNILKIKNFDAILLDWNLGDQSGVRILEYLSSIPKEKQPAVFVLSSESSGKINLQVKPNSVAAVMERPVAISEVIKTIDQNLGNYAGKLTNISCIPYNTAILTDTLRTH